MRTRLQLKLPVILGGILFCGHSLLVVGVWRASMRSIEFGVLWEHMRLTDLPVSLFLDQFYDAYWKLFPQGSYPKPEVLFHLIIGGLQFFVWGWLLGIIIKKLLRTRRPAQTV